MLISRTAQYALRALALLTARQDRMTVKELAQLVGAPHPYLARIIMTLADTGMVDARRGPGGGLRLGRPATEIKVIEIVTCFDGNGLFEDCAMGLPGCHTSEDHCPLHEEWGCLRERVREWWTSTTLADFRPEHVEQCMKMRVPGIGHDGHHDEQLV